MRGRLRYDVPDDRLGFFQGRRGRAMQASWSCSGVARRSAASVELRRLSSRCFRCEGRKICVQRGCVHDYRLA